MTGSYRTIVADPPWHYDAVPATAPSGRNKIARAGKPISKSLPYQTMRLDEIEALTIRDLAEPEGARLFLWATNRYLPAAFGVLEAWGFRYRQTMVWHKLNVPPFGGSVARNTAEFLLVATVGKVERIGPLLPSAVFARGVSKAHSQKPDVFLDMVESVSPAPRLEMFSRRARLGWDTWGNESLHGGEAA